MIGDRAAEAEQHVRECAECEQRVEQLQEFAGDVSRGRSGNG